MVAGIVLAAGMSTRMGELKQLLPFAQKPTIHWIVETLCESLESVVVVLGHRSGEIATVLANSPVQCVINSDYKLGMLSSVKCALQTLGRSADYLICLGDQPRLDKRVVELVLAAAENSECGICIPTFNGKRGHPILIKNAYRTEIMGLDLNNGLNNVTRGHPDDTCEIPIDIASILDDMDTPEDYQRELKLWPKR